MMEELFKHELALREVTESGNQLVFPSQFTRERPDAPELSGRSIIFTFEGAPSNIYATLAVRLSHSRIFRKSEMWRNAAVYTASVGGTCGLHLREPREGEGELTLFFDATASEATRFQFEDYVAAHLERRSLLHSVKRRRIFSCPRCDEPVTDNQASRRLERGFKTMRCPVCDTEFPLTDREERLQSPVRSTVAEMDEAADAERQLATAGMTLKGKTAVGEYDVFISYNRKDRDAVFSIIEQLELRGIRPWVDERELRPGLPWQRALEAQISRLKAAAVFVGEGGIGPWQELEQEAFLRQFVNRSAPVIPVILPGSKETPKLPTFLESMTWVDFRVNQPEPVDRLVWGITGQRGELD
jgi:hypothetical protein